MAVCSDCSTARRRCAIGSMVALLLLLLINVFVVPFTVAPDGVFARFARDVLLSLSF